MRPDKLRELLERVRAGDVSIESAEEQLERLPFAELEYATIDHHRALRQGVPEVILAESKTPEQTAGVARELIARGQNVLITRLDAAAAVAVIELVPELSYRPSARVATYVSEPLKRPTPSPVPVVTAGTSDLPVADEALATLEMCGIESQLVCDVGVAGLHRIVGKLDVIARAPAVIVVAGMEGALASVVGGLVAVPVIAVPTSVGYGVSRDGMTALFGMLASCAAGITVVNIDNGFGAAMAVLRLLKSGERA